MFAGAAREAVFSRPEVIRQVNAEFIPVAIRAAHVEGYRQGEEGRLFAGLRESRPAPQGIAVLNQAGQALDWVLMFERPAAIGAFLTHARKRYQDNPAGTRPVSTERFRRYPSMRMDAILAPDARPVPAKHPAGETCPADQLYPTDALVAQVVGRALQADGTPVADTLRQEHYIQDQMPIPAALQGRLAALLADAGGKRVKLPDEFARLIATHAHLGTLDVQILSNPTGGTQTIKELAFFAEPPPAGSQLWRLSGVSDVAGKSRPGHQPDYENQVRLAWRGYLAVGNRRIRRLVLLADGRERLRWGGAGGPASRDDEVRFLPAGHFIDLTTNVRFGIETRSAGRGAQ